jgi:hypothetical protein
MIVAFRLSWMRGFLMASDGRDLKKTGATETRRASLE